MKSSNLVSYLNKRLEETVKSFDSRKQSNSENINPFIDISNALNCPKIDKNIKPLFTARNSRSSFLSQRSERTTTRSQKNDKKLIPSYALDAVKLIIDRISIHLTKSFDIFNENCKNNRDVKIQQNPPTPSKITSAEKKQLTKKDEYLLKVFGDTEKHQVNIKLKELDEIITLSAAKDLKKFARPRTRTINYQKTSSIINNPSKSQLSSPVNSRNIVSCASATNCINSPPKTVNKQNPKLNNTPHIIANNYSKYANQLGQKSGQKNSNSKPSVKARIEMAKQKLENIKNLGIMSLVSAPTIEKQLENIGTIESSKFTKNLTKLTQKFQLKNLAE